MRDITERLRTAYEAAKYVPGDCPIIPVKIDRFMKEVGNILVALAADAEGAGPVAVSTND